MMKAELFYIDNIPAVLYGEKTDKLYLFIHGKMGRKEEAAEFAKDVCFKGYQVLGIDLPEHGERKSKTDLFVPWEVTLELQTVIKYAKDNWSQISLRANSIGAWFSLLAYRDENFVKSLFVSPILDMERLILDMMQKASVTEEELSRRGIIKTDFGETLDWKYYQYAKRNKISIWNSPTAILYAENDNLTRRQTVDEFVMKFKCRLTVAKDGEHWFHTPKQIAILSEWTQKNC